MAMPTSIAFHQGFLLSKKAGYDLERVFYLSILISFAGAITAFGISGSLVFASALNIIDLEQSFMTTLIRLSMFMSSLAAVIQFFIDGYI